MELKGKKMLFLGDSITEGVGVSDLGLTYWKRLAENDGVDAKGYGIKGTTIAKQQKHYCKTWDKYFRTRIEEMDAEADVVVVFGGTNDYGHGDVPFGKMSDRTDDSFYGALHNLFIDLINKYPTAQMVVMTPLHRLEEEKQYNEVGIRSCGTLKDYVEIIKEVAGYYAIPILDLYSTSGFQPEIEVIKNIYMPDGVHPSDAGHERIYNRLKNFLKDL